MTLGYRRGRLPDRLLDRIVLISMTAHSVFPSPFSYKTMSLDTITPEKSSGLISKILSPALRLWLRSQVEQIEDLQLQIDGRDRQILSGHVPGVFLKSRRAIYRGLHLGDVKLAGQNIRINIGQIIKGKPLQLLEPIQLGGEIRLEQADLQSSLSSEILVGAFRELLIALLDLQGVAAPEQQLAPFAIAWENIVLDSNHFTLTGTLTPKEGNQTPLKIHAALELLSPQCLQLTPVILDILPGLTSDNLSAFAVNLGKDVELEALVVEAGHLFCQGRLLVRP